ncbi:MAG: DNRLRE domain-containing protein [Sedimentisphaerales bacterium]|nr:DNRLRE domain-containing protein [Sedimentisphaerales bacterium]
MIRKNRIARTLVLFASLFLLASVASAATYYVDSVSGSDGNDAKSPQSAWKSLEKVNGTTFAPGDAILFKCGGLWSGELWPKGSGSDGRPIRIDNYGDPQQGLPLINANGAGTYSDAAVYLKNQEYWEIANLEITNHDGNRNRPKTGVYVYVSAPDLPAEKTTLRHIHLLNLVIHDIDGETNTNEINENATGIDIHIYGDRDVDTPRKFDDILIQGCHIYDVVAVGVVTTSDFMTRTAEKNLTWTPWTNVRIRNNVFERIGVWTIFVRVTDSDVVEYNLATGGNAPFNDGNEGNCFVMFNTDNSLWQFNEVYDHKKPLGETADGAAYDIDYMCRNAVVQYNYSHDNGMCFALCCNGKPGGNRLSGFSFDHVLRYNISQNETDEVAHITGPANDCTIYNNTFYLGPDRTGVPMVKHRYWNGWPDNILYANNIFYSVNPGNIYVLGETTRCSFSHNAFYGAHDPSEPHDPHKITADPRLAHPGTGGAGLDTVFGYKLLPDSPCIDAGLAIPDNGARDYWGNPVPCNAAPDIGAHEWSNDSPVVLAPTDDTYVRGTGSENDNYGPAAKLAVKYIPRYTSRQRFAYLKFQLPDPQPPMTHATLRLKVRTLEVPAVHAVHYLPHDDWRESTLTWNTRPDPADTLDTQPVPTPGRWIEFNVTDQIRKEYNNPDDRLISFVIAETTENGYTEYYSDEDSCIENRPRLLLR